MVKLEEDILDLMQQCVPRAKQRCRRHLPWINKNIMRAIKRRDHLYRKFKILQSVSAWRRYKKMRNRVVKLIRSSRAIIFSNLSRAANDLQTFWKIVNTLNTFSSHIPTLVSDNTLVSEDAEKAEVLNIFFGESFNKSDPPLHLNISMTPPQIYH